MSEETAWVQPNSRAELSAQISRPRSEAGPARQYQTTLTLFCCSFCGSVAADHVPSEVTSITPLPDGVSIRDRAFFDCPLNDEAVAVVRAINCWAV